MRADQDRSSSTFGAFGIYLFELEDMLCMLTNFQAKLNQILRIEEELGDKAVYVGTNFRNAVNL